MRFETSQTTPAFLDRRLQLRMLSFVGLIAIIMIALNALNDHPATKNARLQLQANTSPDSLIFEVRREERELKPGEFVIPASDDDGIRGQSPRLRTESTAQERAMFVPRGKERNRDEVLDEKLFRQRKSTSRPPVEPFSTSDDGLVTSDRIPFDEEPTHSRQPRDEVHRTPTADSSSIDDDWNSDQLPTIVIDERKPIRGQHPSQVPGTPRREAPTSAPFDDEPVPFRPNLVETDEIPNSREKIDPTEEEIVRENLKFSRQPKRTPNVKPFEQDQEFFDSRNRQPPIDLRRRDEFTPDRSANEAQTNRDEIAPVRIDKRHLDVVKDNTIGVRRDEAEAFYWLLDHARRVPASSLQKAGDRELQYINLMTEPDRYRGEPVTIEGDLFRLYEFEAGRNKYGVTKVYEGWVFTGDSSHHPYRIVCTSLPNGIEPGESLRKPVRITGYFFKREGYRSNGGVHIAPTLLARRININPTPNGIPLSSGILPYMTGAIMAIGLALLVTVVGFAIGDGRESRAEMQRQQRHPQPSFAGIDLPETISVEESLRQLAEQEWESAVGGAYGPLLSRQSVLEHAANDDSRSHQAQKEETQRQYRKQTGTLKSWAARKQAAQAEIDALREAQADPQMTTDDLADELNLDRLDPAQNVLVRPKEVEVQHSPRATSHDHPILPTERIRNRTSTSSTVRPLPAVPHDPNHIVSEETRLSAYEDEVARMTSHQTEIRAINPFSDQESEKAIASQIVEEQFLHEQESRNQKNLDDLQRDNSPDHHSTVDRDDRETVSFSLPSSSRFDQLRRRKQPDDSDMNDASDVAETDESINDLDSGSVSRESSAELKRSRRNRRDWRKGKTG